MAAAMLAAGSTSQRQRTKHGRVRIGERYGIRVAPG
jgi:hypothetical protein